MDGDWTDIRDETVTDYLRDGILTQSSLVSSRTGNPVVKPGIGAELYYNLKTDGRGSSLDISANYSAYYDNSRIGTDITGPAPQSWIQQTVQDFRAAEGKAVYRHIFSDGSTLNRPPVERSSVEHGRPARRIHPHLRQTRGDRRGGEPKLLQSVPVRLGDAESRRGETQPHAGLPDEHRPAFLHPSQPVQDMDHGEYLQHR